MSQSPPKWDSFVEQSVGLLLAIVGGRQEVQFLLPPLMKLGLSEILINLLATEVARLTGERMPERYMPCCVAKSLIHINFCLIGSAYDVMKYVLVLAILITVSLTA